MQTLLNAQLMKSECITPINTAIVCRCTITSIPDDLVKFVKRDRSEGYASWVPIIAIVNDIKTTISMYVYQDYVLVPSEFLVLLLLFIFIEREESGQSSYSPYEVRFIY